MVTCQTADAVWRAISDPTRRAIIDMLREDELPIGAVADRFDISRPAISRHFRVLRRAGLVRVRHDGRERWYRLDPQPLRTIDDWLGDYRSLWRAALPRLKAHVERQR